MELLAGSNGPQRAPPSRILSPCPPNPLALAVATEPPGRRPAAGRLSSPADGIEEAEGGVMTLPKGQEPSCKTASQLACHVSKERCAGGFWTVYDPLSTI